MKQAVVRSAPAHESGTLRNYVTGFVLSIGFTLLAYLAAVNHWAMGWTLAIMLLALAIVQFFVQMAFFLHLFQEGKPRSRQLVVMLMIIIVLILVVGSIWIMYNLSNRQMLSPGAMRQYMQAQVGF